VIVVVTEDPQKIDMYQPGAGMDLGISWMWIRPSAKLIDLLRKPLPARQCALRQHMTTHWVVWGHAY